MLNDVWYRQSNPDALINASSSNYTQMPEVRTVDFNPDDNGMVVPQQVVSVEADPTISAGGSLAMGQSVPTQNRFIQNIPNQ